MMTLKRRKSQRPRKRTQRKGESNMVVRSYSELSAFERDFKRYINKSLEELLKEYFRRRKGMNNDEEFPFYLCEMYRNLNERDRDNWYELYGKNFRAMRNKIVKHVGIPHNAVFRIVGVYGMVVVLFNFYNKDGIRHFVGDHLYLINDGEYLYIPALNFSYTKSGLAVDITYLLNNVKWKLDVKKKKRLPNGKKGVSRWVIYYIWWPALFSYIKAQRYCTEEIMQKLYLRKLFATEQDQEQETN